MVHLVNRTVYSHSTMQHMLVLQKVKVLVHSRRVPLGSLSTHACNILHILKGPLTNLKPLISNLMDLNIGDPGMMPDTTLRVYSLTLHISQKPITVIKEDGIM